MSGFVPARGLLQAPVAFGAGGPPSWVTYGELFARARGLASVLPQGTDALLLCEDRFWFAVGLLGTWQAGGRVVLPPHRGSAVLAQLGSRHLVLADTPLRGFEQVLDVRNVPPGDVRPPESHSNERELVTLYTSGSRGTPVRWHKRARQLIGEAEVLVRQMGMTAADRVLPTVAPQHIYGLLFGVLAPLVAGASFARETPLHGEAIFNTAARGGASWLISVPAHLEVLLRLQERHRIDASWPVRSVLSSGAPLDVELARTLRAHGLDVIDVLGSTETGGLGLRRTGEEELWTPLEGVQLRTDDEEKLLVKSMFLDDPNQWTQASDRVFIRDDGRFGHLGRADDVAKIGGKRIALGEVEAFARSVTGVRDAAALRRPVGGLRGEEIWLAVVAPERSAADVRAALQELVDPVFVPRRIRVFAELPRQESGKLRWQDLRQAFGLEAGALELRQLSYDARSASARAFVPSGWHRFEGHFPDSPVVPGVSQLHDFVLPVARAAWPDLGALERIQRVKFQAPLLGDTTVTVALERSLTKVSFELRDVSRVLARGVLWFQGEKLAASAPDVR